MPSLCYGNDSLPCQLEWLRGQEGGGGGGGDRVGCQYLCSRVFIVDCLCTTFTSCLFIENMPIIDYNVLFSEQFFFFFGRGGGVQLNSSACTVLCLYCCTKHLYLHNNYVLLPSYPSPLPQPFTIVIPGRVLLNEGEVSLVVEKKKKKKVMNR